MGFPEQNWAINYKARMADYKFVHEGKEHPPEMSEIEEETQVPKTPEEWKRKLYEEIKAKIGRVDDTDSFIISLPDRKLKAELCIYRVPEKLRKVKEDAYSPRVVAIGPFHRDKTTLAPMSDHKLSYMASFLAQYTGDKKQAAKRLKDCIAAIHGLDEAIRHCYIEKMESEISTHDELAEMMLVDGCFILELFLRTHLKFDYMWKHQYESDPVLRSPWTMAAIRHDLALLENQIPFFILEILYGFICPIVKKRCKAPKSVSSLALSFFKPMSRKEIREEAPDTESKHLLDLLHKFYFPLVPAASVLSANGNDIESNNPRRKRNGRLAKKNWGFGYCASELMESGIEFRKEPSSEESLLNITFNRPPKDGVINIPQLLIHDTTSFSLFRNLIAFEQCSLSTTQSITSYAFLMKSLISSSLDSKLLERRGIIEHSSNGEKEYLATKFRSIVDGVDLMDDFCFRELCDRVNEYQKSWNNPKRRLKVFFRKQKRILWANYLSSAWKVMSILAAVTILILTSLQTFYTIHPRN
ncbi:PREDICTED: UPF0481 protein At3g47200-like isoform X2 [Fragaria vesca subsp. vesca]|uniref:UPF0481 protein At3g47200-like isoform X2 n=1 Tax=Fragaria vesca subsp. vesca TaxID=101020 RepID=UPI0002C34D93|nr:PREDICTED: UPF0481 protein At3g47200-like isoform X2 [Fragaria vesca subsp. vesca]